jgi:hypothetical protein
LIITTSRAGLKKLEGGEKIMNKKVSLIVLVMGFLMLLAAVAPVMAAPATKVSASTHLISIAWTLGPITETTPSGVNHTYAEYTNERTLTIGGTTYDVYVVGSMDYNMNPKTGVANLRFTAVWYVGSLTDPTSDGFSVNLHEKLYAYTTPPPPLVTAHGVWQGFGSYAQYTLKMDYEGLYPGAGDLSGYCIIP